MIEGESVLYTDVQRSKTGDAVRPGGAKLRSLLGRDAGVISVY